MSQTYYLVCLDAKEWVWIGQGRGEMSILYYGCHKTMEQLKRFLNTYHDTALQCVCADTTAFLYEDGWKEFEAPEATRYGHPLEGTQYLTPQEFLARRQEENARGLDASWE